VFLKLCYQVLLWVFCQVQFQSSSQVYLPVNIIIYSPHAWLYAANYTPSTLSNQSPNMLSSKPLSILNSAHLSMFSITIQVVFTGTRPASLTVLSYMCCQKSSRYTSEYAPNYTTKHTPKYTSKLFSRSLPIAPDGILPDFLNLFSQVNPLWTKYSQYHLIIFSQECL